MKKKTDQVVKRNWLNESIQVLSLSELRIIQIAIVDARETGKGLKLGEPLTITKARYAEVFETTPQNAYARMKEAEKTLFDRRFTFIRPDTKNPVKSRWLQEVEYGDGEIHIVFTKAVVDAITRIDGFGLKDVFTSYFLEHTVNLNSKYSTRLYELLIQWKTAKNAKFELEKFRHQLGVDIDEYTKMSDFKKRVLKPALDEINEHTDITAKYKNIKKGVKIIGFEFTIKEKKKPKEEEKEIKLSDKQINLFSSLLAHDHIFGRKYAATGELTPAFINRIKEKLKDPSYVKKWEEDLKRVGFDPKK